MANLDTKTLLDVIQILKELKAIIIGQNPYLPVYSALGGAFIGAISTFIPNAMIDYLKTRRDRKTLTLAIYAEIKASLELIKLRSYIQDIKEIIQKLKDNTIQDEIYQIIVPNDHSIVYKNNISKIGILKPNLQVNIVQFYQLLEGVILDVKPGGLLNSRPRGVNEFESVLAIGEEMIIYGNDILKKIEKLYSTS